MWIFDSSDALQKHYDEKTNKTIWWMPWLLATSWDVCYCVVKRWWSWFSKCSSTGLQHRNVCSHVQKFAHKTSNFWPKWLAFYLFKSVKANNFPTRTAGKSVLTSSFQHTFSPRNKGHACASFADTTYIKYSSSLKEITLSFQRKG